MDVLSDLDSGEVEAAAVGDPVEWDSVAHVVLIALIEESFGIRLSDDELAGLTSFRAVEAAVKGHTGGED